MTGGKGELSPPSSLCYGRVVSDRQAERLIVALDTTSVAQAATWARAVTPYCGLFKLGLEFFLANGPEGVRAMTGRPVFLDLKLHDIPNSVAGGIRAIIPLAPRMVTLHAAGGGKMIEAARSAVETRQAIRPLLLAVTVLTSLDARALAETGIQNAPAKQVLRLARLALSAGADGLVCSPLEVAMLRQELGTAPVLVVPGIRPAGSEMGDQARTMTPEEAISAGADWIVVGRPITASSDPAFSASSILASITKN